MPAKQASTNDHVAETPGAKSVITQDLIERIREALLVLISVDVTDELEGVRLADLVHVHMLDISHFII